MDNLPPPSVPRAAAHGAKSNRDDQTMVIIRVYVLFIPTPFTIYEDTKGVFAAGYSILSTLIGIHAPTEARLAVELFLDGAP